MRPLRLARACLALTVAAASGALAQPASQRWPVTEQQRRTADQVAQAGVPLSELAPNAPDSYTVKRGDTLWDISAIFLRSPWRWPELWGMNKQQIANPHLIYPGQTLVLIRGADGRARLQVADSTALPGAPGDVVKLSPRVRIADGERAGAISSIPNNLIEPFLSQPLIVGANELAGYARIVATPEGRVNLGRADTAYARGIGDDPVENYHVFRPAKPLFDPDDEARRTPIAYEALYLGTARLIKRGEVATLRIQDSKQEIGVGDRLVPIERQPLIAYVPRRPERAIDGRIVSVYGGVAHAGPYSVVALNRGRADGLEIGHVLALLETGATVRDRTVPGREFVKLPDERIGTMFVFRVFDRIAYALIMTSTKPVKVGDRFTQPDELPSADAEPRPAASAVPMAAPVGGPQTVSPMR
ncbi:MAG: LysM domain-containing protein [Sutterellaceae bacterium]|nr:LysM peptidoglycan-binding domain-containing protein [Burkholderiaceae bacterium]MDW8429284.1 LysM domain-containing protein [Sutterellaceae bacterium]